MAEITAPTIQSRKDFASEQSARWCPGCGDYAILAQMQRTLPKMNIPREKYVFISGIGCSSRFPYYMNTYGFHTIHGRAPVIATGVKCANPDLTVWVITGDGDALSIGGNHFLHIMRRNLDINIVLFNNRIYGLTKGQYSPTSEFGKITKSSPMGSIDYSFHPVTVALAAEATFVARTSDADTQHMSEMFQAAMEHKGVSFIEVYQNCLIFNNKTHEQITAKTNRPERSFYLEHGKPIVFGNNKDKGIRLNKDHKPEVISLIDGKYSLDDVLVFDETSMSQSFLMSTMHFPDYPVPFGIFRRVKKPTYDEMLWNQVKDAKEKFGKGDLDKLFHEGETWEVKG